jgi:hypothetical protein
MNEWGCGVSVWDMAQSPNMVGRGSRTAACIRGVRKGLHDAVCKVDSLPSRGPASCSRNRVRDWPIVFKACQIMGPRLGSRSAESVTIEPKTIHLAKRSSLCRSLAPPKLGPTPPDTRLSSPPVAPIIPGWFYENYYCI